MDAFAKDRARTLARSYALRKLRERFLPEFYALYFGRLKELGYPEADLEMAKVAVEESAGIRITEGDSDE